MRGGRGIVGSEFWRSYFLTSFSMNSALLGRLKLLALEPRGGIFMAGPSKARSGGPPIPPIIMPIMRPWGMPGPLVGVNLRYTSNILWLSGCETICHSTVLDWTMD